MSPRRYRRTPVVPQMEQQDCGGACLVSVLAAFGKHVCLHEANRACGVTRDGVTAAALVRAAGSYGLKSSAKRVRRDERKAYDGLAALAVPSVVLMTGPHFAVFEGIRRGMARVNDPSLGRYAVRPDEFWAKFAGIAVGFTPGPDFRAGGRRFPLARDLAARVRPFFGPLVAAVGIALLVSAPGVAAALLFRSATAHASQVTSTTDTATLFAVAAAACAALVLIGTWAQQLLLSRVLTTMSFHSSTRFLWRMIRLPGVFFHRRALGGLVTRVQLNDGMAVLLSGRIAAALVSVVSSALYLVTLFWVDPTLAPIAAGVAIGQVGVLTIVARRRGSRLHTLNNATARRDAVAFAGVAAIETIKAEGSEDVLFRTWTGWQARVLNIGQDIMSTTVGLFSFSTVLNTVGSGLAIVLGMRQLIAGDITYPTLLAFLLLMNGFLLPIGTLVGLGSELLNAKAQAALLQDVESAEPDPFLRPVLPADGDARPVEPLRGGLALHGVNFGYDPARAPLIESLSLDLQPGEWVAVVGTSGSGKSTLARLAAGVLRPWSGHIVLDGTPRDDLPRAAVTAGVSYVEQRPRLFEGSVRDNLSLWSATVDEAAMWQALTDADADALVRRRGGLDGAAIEEDARNLSGGERQRLEIARALATNPAVLVLDEATSALDAETEVRLNANLRARGCSCLILAHRLSTVRAADRVFVMSGGRLVQEGSHDELVTVAGPYRELVGELS